MKIHPLLLSLSAFDISTGWVWLYSQRNSMQSKSCDSINECIFINAAYKTGYMQSGPSRPNAIPSSRLWCDLILFQNDFPLASKCVLLPALSQSEQTDEPKILHLCNLSKSTCSLPVLHAARVRQPTVPASTVPCGLSEANSAR